VKSFSSYSHVFFDCDGVILDANEIKSDAFYEVALSRFGKDIALDFKKYHEEKGGISRYKKFNYLLSITSQLNKSITLESLLQDYAELIFKKLLNCQIVSSLSTLRRENPDQKWYIVSGGNQEELLHIFAERQIDNYFDGGIYGSPDDKRTIINKIMGANFNHLNKLFIGDSAYDFDVASSLDLDFIFASNWTQLKDWREFCSSNKINFIPDISYLVRIGK
jgi:phosphoglycolate phosphatase-like HAD superfamily hydrolase